MRRAILCLLLLLAIVHAAIPAKPAQRPKQTVLSPVPLSQEQKQRLRQEPSVPSSNQLEQAISNTAAAKAASPAGSEKWAELNNQLTDYQNQLGSNAVQTPSFASTELQQQRVSQSAALQSAAATLASANNNAASTKTATVAAANSNAASSKTAGTNAAANVASKVAANANANVASSSTKLGSTVQANAGKSASDAVVNGRSVAAASSVSAAAANANKVVSSRQPAVDASNNAALNTGNNVPRLGADLTNAAAAASVGASQPDQFGDAGSNNGNAQPAVATPAPSSPTAEPTAQQCASAPSHTNLNPPLNGPLVPAAVAAPGQELQGAGNGGCAKPYVAPELRGSTAPSAPPESVPASVYAASADHERHVRAELVNAPLQTRVPQLSSSGWGNAMTRVPQLVRRHLEYQAEVPEVPENEEQPGEPAQENGSQWGRRDIWGRRQPETVKIDGVTYHKPRVVPDHVYSKILNLPAYGVERPAAESTDAAEQAEAAYAKGESEDEEGEEQAAAAAPAPAENGEPRAVSPEWSDNATPAKPGTTEFDHQGVTAETPGRSPEEAEEHALEAHEVADHGEAATEPNEAEEGKDTPPPKSAEAEEEEEPKPAVAAAAAPEEEEEEKEEAPKAPQSAAEQEEAPKATESEAEEEAAPKAPQSPAEQGVEPPKAPQSAAEEEEEEGKEKETTSAAATGAEPAKAASTEEEEEESEKPAATTTTATAAAKETEEEEEETEEKEKASSTATASNTPAAAAVAPAVTGIAQDIEDVEEDIEKLKTSVGEASM